MNPDGTIQTNLTNNSHNDSMPSWSLDGSKIAFASDRHGDGDIFVMDEDGSGQSRLTNLGGDEEYPRWSPDGERIASIGGNDLYVINSDGTEMRQLFQGGRNPEWFPDGNRIVFNANPPV